LAGGIGEVGQLQEQEADVEVRIDGFEADNRRPASEVAIDMTTQGTPVFSVDTLYRPLKQAPPGQA